MSEENNVRNRGAHGTAPRYLDKILVGKVGKVERVLELKATRQAGVDVLKHLPHLVFVPTTPTMYVNEED